MTDAGKGIPEEQDKNGGAGPEGTIPESGDGVAASSTDEASSFEPEEDADAGS
ncbi:hypothetical protein ITX31_05325 [Arthrobacter gandavensis]|uniref:hypothetical protein n=1 Tax=Arthrobacter gandavensis TaxID=169960 RepID=UPI00188F9F03|nr:hypothetical protein [Arthrobacter gandavensis]MBF4993528.1 hypothetical protein [Arthrobacter gandavensis]